VQISKCALTELNNWISQSISPINKRAEGLAPVWGSEFTTKAATLQRGVGGSAEIAPTHNVKLKNSVTSVGVLATRLKLDTRFKSI
jgi:hypothetical protein